MNKLVTGRHQLKTKNVAIWAQFLFISSFKLFYSLWRIGWCKEHGYISLEDDPRWLPSQDYQDHSIGRSRCFTEVALYDVKTKNEMYMYLFLYFTDVMLIFFFHIDLFNVCINLSVCKCGLFCDLFELFVSSISFI